MFRCPFCLPALDSTQVALENAHCLFLQRPEPVLIGSGLIIPRQHRATIFDLAPEEWAAIFALLQQVKTLIN